MIIVLGSINLDLIANLPRLPAAGETLTGHDFKTAPGGKGANQALAARKAGAEVAMLGAVGSDAHADEALLLLKEFGVNCDSIQTVDQPTGTALILVGDDTGDNMIAVIPGANGTVSISANGTVSAAAIGSAKDTAAIGSAKDIAAIGSAQILSANDTALLQLEIPLSAVEAMLTEAKHVGATSILNIAPWQEGAGPLCTACDILVANETEFDLASQALGLNGESRKDRMADYVARFGKIIIVTLGENGAIAQGPDMALEVPTIRVDAIDTVGAGDTFCGYLAALLAEGKTLEHALKAAGIAGALACTKQGAQPSMPLRAEVDQLLG